MTDRKSSRKDRFIFNERHDVGMTYKASVLSVLIASTQLFSGCSTFNSMGVTNASPSDVVTTAPTVDPIDTGEAKGFKTGQFEPIDISLPKRDENFGINFKDYQREWAETHNTEAYRIDGKPLTDPTGHIVAISRLSSTGSITYLRDKPRQDNTKFKQFDLVLLDPNTGNRRIIGSMLATPEGLEFHWNGTRLLAEGYFLTSKGAVLFKDDGRIVTLLSGTRPPLSIALPDGYKAVDFGIKSDIEFSRHIPIIKHIRNSKIYGFIPSSTDEVYEVSFLNLDTGNITSTSSNVNINVSSRKAFENYVAYSATLLDSASGPLSICVEENDTKTVVRNLATLEKHTIVETAWRQGHGFEAGLERRSMDENYGKVWVKFGLGNSNMTLQTVEDLEGWMVSQKQRARKTVQ